LRTGASLESLLNNVEIDNKIDVRLINGDVLSGHKVDSNGYLGHYNNKLCVLKEGNQYRLFGWIPFINNTVPSIYKTSFSWLFNNKEKDYDTNLNGEERAFVATGEMESVFPMDIYPMQLIKESMIGDIEKMEKLGIYEVSPEDFGLIDYSSSSKIEAQTIIRQGLDYIYKETQ
jgi:Na+-transporting NADH:ubiquinone oxidoreductase subunit A